MRFEPMAIATALAAMCLAPLAAAQASSPILEHYRAYTLALDRGDLNAAAVEAEAALPLRRRATATAVARQSWLTTLLLCTCRRGATLKHAPTLSVP